MGRSPRPNEGVGRKQGDGEAQTIAVAEFTPDHNEKSKKWHPTNDKTDKVVNFGQGRRNEGRVIDKAVGPEGGSIKAQKNPGEFEEERTYPGSKDPKRSKG